MLILGRRVNQSIVFPNCGITVRVLDVNGRVAKIGIEAPRSIEIMRGELALASAHTDSSSSQNARYEHASAPECELPVLQFAQRLANIKASLHQFQQRRAAGDENGADQVLGALSPIPGDEPLRGYLLCILRWVTARPFFVSIAAILVCVVAGWGALRLKVETDFIKNFRSDAPLVVAYRAVEAELGGAGVWDVVVPAPKVLTQVYLDQVAELEKSLMALNVPGSEPGEPLRLTKVMSFADADKAAQLSTSLGLLTIEGRLLGMKQVMGSFVSTLVTDFEGNARYLRIMLRSREQAEATQKEQLIAEVRRTVDDAVRSDAWGTGGNRTATVSGYYVLLSQLVSSVVADQWRCFAVATFGIWIAMSIALRAPWLALLAILPNALPSLCILGWLGWTDTRVNLGAAMIAAVSMGLSVDSSLHYLIRFQRERALGLSRGDAMSEAQSETGMAILLSTIALVLGFGSLSTSHFLPTVVFGTTASISMLGGLACNLVVLPALVCMFGTRTASRE